MIRIIAVRTGTKYNKWYEDAVDTSWKNDDIPENH